MNFRADSGKMGESEKVLIHPSDPIQRPVRRSPVPDENSIRYIPLTQGKQAIVDAADYEWLMQWKWCATERKHTWYAVRNQASAETKHKKSSILMHRQILGLSSRAELADHRDGNGLNNTRSNLRAATTQQNSFNSRKHRDSTNHLKGVYWHARAKKWMASVCKDGKQIYLGLFTRPEDAAAERRKHAEILHGTFYSEER